MTQEV